MNTVLPVIHRSGIDDEVRIINHANSPLCPKRMLELNPALGCEFRCQYCGIYALEKQFYDNVIVYDDFPDYLDRWLAEHGGENYYFYFSAKTDCLQPALIDSGITLACLEILNKHGAQYFIVTKGGLPPKPICSALVAGRDLNQVIVSVTMPDEAMRELIEPGAAANRDRIEFVKFCVDQNIQVTASCCPVMPFGDYDYLRDVIQMLADAGIRHFYFDFARLSREAIERMIDLMPQYRQEFEQCYFTDDARKSSWEIRYRGVTIEKYQPPEKQMLRAFQSLKELVRDVVSDGTVSICNHFNTATTLPGFNREARAECLSCMGQRFDRVGPS